LRAYIFRRLAWLPLILLITTFITFMLGRFGPGDPVEILMGQHSDPRVVERIREQRGLNDNVLLQYGRYLKNVTRGDFGESYKYRGRTVGELLKKKMWVSGQLNIAALMISVGLGIPIGLFAALKQGTLWDTAAVVATLIGQSLPVFLTAPTLLLVFALKLDVLPTHGWGGFFDTRIILPAVAMGIPGVAIMTRLTRASTLDVVTQDYIRTARAKGLPERIVRSRHILRNSLIPVVTTLGFSLAGLAFTSFIVERFFGIPGVGSLFIEAIFARDYPIINAIIIIGTTMFVLANLVVDLIYPLMDPRIRLGGSYVAG
jgi:ABC-type dipeptide/oligopeptide/nickel transport system permease component|tara:strand:- start:15 stop:962 length:948 start_codon:yes stop_codon:yes gene_type:complete